MHILIAVPTFENITPDTFKSIFDLDKAGHDVSFEFVRGYDCATARNRIAQRGLSTDADYIFMIDNDVTVPVDAIRYFTEEPVDVCLGYYAHRNADNKYTGRTCLCKLYDKDGTAYFNYPLESEYTVQEIEALRSSNRVKIHGGGMGCAFISSKVFRTIEYPWYDWVNYKGPKRSMLSEDLYFCEACRKAGIPIYMDPRVSCGHMFRYIQQP